MGVDAEDVPHSGVGRDDEAEGHEELTNNTQEE